MGGIECPRSTRDVENMIKYPGSDVAKIDVPVPLVGTPLHITDLRC